MATLQISLNLKAAETNLKKLEERLRDLSQPMKEIGEHLLTETVMRFERGVDPDGRPWRPNAPATTKRKRGGKILINRGILRQSINYKADRHAVEIGVGNNPPYARIHQYGGKTGRGRRVNIPARPYLGVNATDLKDVADILMQHLKK